MALIRPGTQDGGSSPVLWQRTNDFSAEDMVRYRREMMELVRGAPETAYELTLRDLVEISPPKDAGEAAPEGKKEAKKFESWKKMFLKSERSDSGAFQLRIFLLTGLGKWGRSSGSSAKGSKVSPKPALAMSQKFWQKKVDEDEGRRQGCYGMRRWSGISPQKRKTMGCSPFSIKLDGIRWR